MGNVPLFPVPNPTFAVAGSQDPVQIVKAINRPTRYMCLDPLPQYFQDEVFLAKLASSEGPLTRSAMEPEVKHPPIEEEPKEGLEYSVEAILKKRIRQKKVEYFVKWEDCPEEAATWEPEENLKRFPILTEDFEREWRAKRIEMKRKNVPPPGPGRGWNSRKRAAKTARAAKKKKWEEKKRLEAEAAAAVEEVQRFRR